MIKKHERVGTFCDKCRQVMCKCVLKEQTAVDWLREQFHKVPFSQFGNLFQKAKEMEKKQIKNAHTHGRNVERGLNDGIYTAEDYYNNIYVKQTDRT